jgi:energy-coupling factor transporter ATP-binding protein EcfA2
VSLKADAISYRYAGAGAPALDSVSLDLKKGELALVCGKNGSGKSTLLCCLAGLVKPSSGHVTIEGEAAERSRRKIGFAVQFPERALFERTAFDDVAFGPRNMVMPADEVQRRVEMAVDAVGLGRDLLNTAPRSLSYGQKRLLAIACAIVHGPEYLFLDEPAAGLDSRGSKRIVELINLLHRDGMTIVVAAHDPVSLLESCSRLIALDDGRIVVDGPPTFANARRAGIRSETMELAERLQGRGMKLRETFSPETLAEDIAGALK